MEGVFEKSSNIHYKPRGTSYKVIYHDIPIKSKEGWVKGCVYQDKDSLKIYCRPYYLFDKRWVVLD